MKKKRTWIWGGKMAVIGMMMAALGCGIFLTEARAPEEEIQEHNIQAETAVESRLFAAADCSLLQTMAFSRCGHSVQRRVKLPREMEGSGLEEIQARYDQWHIEEFQKNQISMRREIELFCPMHKVLTADEAGQIVLAENLYGDGMAVICVYEKMLHQMEEADQNSLLLGMGFDSREEAEAWLLAH